MKKKSKKSAVVLSEARLKPDGGLIRLPLVLHRTFERSDEGEPTYYVIQDGKLLKLEGVEIAAWIESLDASTTVRLTSMSTYMNVLFGLKDRGVKLLHCNWHKTGIEKGLSPDKIAMAFAGLDESLFTEFKPRKDLLTLKKYCAVRAAVMQYRIAAGQKIMEETRSLGLKDDDKPDFLQSAEEELAADVKLTETPLEKEISNLAKKIPECVLLNGILAVSNKSWMTSAVVMGHLQNIDRFATISKLWHYAGFHVVNGRCAKRSKGQVQTWNGELRTALWKWADSMLKTKNPVWRPVYETYLKEEDARHPAVCSKETCGGGSRTGHIGARARRRVIKDVLKELFIAVRGGYRPDISVQVQPTEKPLQTATQVSAKSASGD